MSTLDQLGQTIRGALSRLMGAPTADEKAVRELVKGLQRALLMADVKAELVVSLSESIREKALRERLPPGISRKEHIVKIVYDEMVALVGEKARALPLGEKLPFVIMVVGIQGSGKTTTVAKLANYLSKTGSPTGVVCADTFRPGALEQLSQLVRESDISVYGEAKSDDAVEIARNGVRKIDEEGKKVVIVDTAGRHKDQRSLMKEMKALEKQITPDEVMLVLDGGIGQQAGPQAKAFNEATKIGSIIVTKLDTSARGGGALSAASATGARIRFIGTGERLDDFEAFAPSRFVGRLLGMGDLEGLIEKVRLAELETSKEAAQAIISGDFTLEQMVAQFKEMRKLGPLRKVIAKLPLPGIPNIPSDQLDRAEDELKKWGVIVQSMTPEERRSPRLIKSSRIRRIARGAGVVERDVKTLLKQYRLARRLMKSWRRKGPLRLKT